MLDWDSFMWNMLLICVNRIIDFILHESGGKLRPWSIFDGKMQKIAFCNGGGCHLHDSLTVTASGIKTPYRQRWWALHVWRSNHQRLVTCNIPSDHQRWWVSSPKGGDRQGWDGHTANPVIEQVSCFDRIFAEDLIHIFNSFC